MPITKIVSGGQTGADRGGLDAALYCEVPHGGWCPKGRKAEDGPIPPKYALTEMASSDYLVRTEANVVDSDATVIFTEKDATGGSLRTLEFCQKHGRPWLCVSLATMGRKKAAKNILAWLAGDPEFNAYDDFKAKPPEACILNVAGSRESKYPGIADAVEEIMVDVLRETNPECHGIYPLLAVLRHRTFFSMGELNAAIRKALEDLNRRPFQKMPGWPPHEHAPSECALLSVSSQASGPAVHFLSTTGILCQPVWPCALAS